MEHERMKGDAEIAPATDAVGATLITNQSTVEKVEATDTVDAWVT